MQAHVLKQLGLSQGLSSSTAKDRYLRCDAENEACAGVLLDQPVSPLIDEHKVIKAKTSNGKSYALDIAGAKFGLYKARLSWRRYVDLHIRETLSSEDIILAQAKADLSRLKKRNRLPCHTLHDGMDPVMLPRTAGP